MRWSMTSRLPRSIRLSVSHLHTSVNTPAPDQQNPALPAKQILQYYPHDPQFHVSRYLFTYTPAHPRLRCSARPQLTLSQIHLSPPHPRNMSFFKRNKGPLIPPVPQPGSASDPYTSPAPSYHTSAASDPYASAGGGGRNGGGGAPDPYANSAARGASAYTGGGDPYASSSAKHDLIAGRRGGAGGAGAGGGSDNPYAKSSEADDALRSELFAGYAAPEKEAKRREYGYEGREQEEDFDEDEEVEGIKQEMRGVKQESLASTRWVRNRLCGARLIE